MCTAFGSENSITTTCIRASGFLHRGRGEAYNDARIVRPGDTGPMPQDRRSGRSDHPKGRAGRAQSRPSARDPAQCTTKKPIVIPTRHHNTRMQNTGRREHLAREEVEPAPWAVELGRHHGRDYAPAEDLDCVRQFEHRTDRLLPSARRQREQWSRQRSPRSSNDSLAEPHIPAPRGEHLFIRPRVVSAEQGTERLVVDQGGQFVTGLLVGELCVPKSVACRLPVCGAKELPAKLANPLGHD